MQQPLFALFLLFGVLGWVIDTLYRSAIDKRFSPGTWIPFFGVAYGLAGVLITLVFRYPLGGALWQIIVSTCIVVLLEYITGALALAVLKRRLWDYTGHRYNIKGHVDMLHAFYWAAIVMLMRVIYHYMPY